MKFVPKINILKKIPYFFLVFLLFASSCVKVNKTTQQNNTYNFNNQNFDDFNVYSVEGTWDFYWDTLLTPQQISEHVLEPKKVEIPSLWTKYEINGKHLPSQGYATYHTQIIAPANKFYSFKFKRIFLACNIYINDSLALKIGKVATTKKNYVANRLTEEFAFFSPKDTIDLTIQVANFSHKKAGLTRNVKFGSPRAIIQYSYSNLLYDMLIIGALTFMMFFYFVLYFQQKSTESYLYFGLFLIVEIISISLDRELIFMKLFPWISWAIASKIFYISLFLRSLMFVIVIESFTSQYFSKTVKKVSIYLTLLLSVFIIFTPMKIYSETLIIMMLFTLLTLFYEIYVTFKASKNDKYILLSFIGLIFIFVTAINDMLFEIGIIKTFFASGFGVFLFTLSQAILLSLKNAKLLNKDDIFSSREEIENKLKKALLTSPSYDVGAGLKAISENVGIETILLFTTSEDNLILHLKVEKNKETTIINEPVDWNKTDNIFNTIELKKAKNRHKTITLSDKSSNINHKNLIIQPIYQQEKLIAVFYFENNYYHLTDTQVSVIKELNSQFNSLINTSLIYFKLKKMNEILENKVKDRTKEVNEQKEELDIKNQSLDEKLQLLEEQYAIQNEINSELLSQIEELEIQNNELEIQTKEINKHNEQISKHNEQIKSNIEYASTILNLLSVHEKPEYQPFKDFFHLDIPKDILSGDFYFSKRIENYFIFALGDCTGHGVPGSLMNIFSSRNLESIILKEYKQKKEIDSSEILNKLRDSIKQSLSTGEEELKDGLDIGVCVYDTTTNQLDFSGAYNSLYLFRDNKLETIKGNRMPIGSYVKGFEFPFTKKTIKILDNDVIYIHSDGFVDQFNSKNNEKYYTSNFKKLLQKIHRKPLNEQKIILHNEFINWKGSYYQLDDVSVIGVKF